MFNEQQNCARCIDAVVAILKKLPIKALLIVINDGSTDQTEKILEQKQKQYPTYLTILTHKKNKGYGTATVTGIKEAQKKKYPWILHMDSDLTNDPKYIKDFIKKADETVDCIKASRYIIGSDVINIPAFRKIVSIIGNSVAALLFDIGIRDCTNGFRMIRLEKIKGLHFTQKGFSIILEELYYLKKRHAVFIEIPYTLTARKNSHSHFSYKPIVFFNYFKYSLLSFFLSKR